ncbi:MAG TPA: hypothetical protein VNS57_13965 [Steroidobacteraceae bacterium]|nr:hypothetical protein [Steroidobacteraceae bacterium]
MKNGHAPGPSPTPSPASQEPPIGTRSFVPPDYHLPDGYDAVGVLAFRAPAAGDTERGRRILICKAYVTTLPDASTVFQQSPDTPQIVTLWPLNGIDKPWSVDAPPAGPMLDALCATSVDHYAHLAGDRWLARLPAEVRPAANRRGPFLIAWAPPSTQVDPNKPVLIVDLTDFQQEGTILEAFAIWKDRIEANPDLWSHGWDRTLLKLQLQAVSDHYGGLVLAAFKLLPFVGDE